MTSKVSVTFIDAQGVVTTLDAPAGWSLMEVAVQHGLPGIVGECGGSCACATCHVHVEAPWFERLPAPTEVELELLQCTAAPATPTSRLGCQVRLTIELNGLVVQTAATQN